MTSALDQLNKLLKESILHEWMRDHRLATAEAIAILIDAIDQTESAPKARIADAIRKIKTPTGRPSIDGERSLLMQIVDEQQRDRKKQSKN